MFKAKARAVRLRPVPFWAGRVSWVKIRVNVRVRARFLLSVMVWLLFRYCNAAKFSLWIHLS